jgi:hypothetical protein
MLPCHGPDANKRQAGFTTDNQKSAYDVLKEHPGAMPSFHFNPIHRRFVF